MHDRNELCSDLACAGDRIAGHLDCDVGSDDSLVRRRGGSSIYLYLFWCEYGSPDRNFSGTVTDFTVGYKTGSHALYEKRTGKNQCGQSDRQNSRSNEGDQ